jgi:general secretion pathway protein D
MSGMVRFVPNQRTKSILVISPQQTYLTRAERWIRSIDAKAQGVEKRLYTYSVRNRPAEELAEIVESMFSSSPRSAPQRGRSVAPRHQPTAVKSPPVEAGKGGAPSLNADTRPDSWNVSTRSSSDDDRVRVSVDEPNNTSDPCVL